MSIEPQKDRGCTVIQLYSGERICATDKYLIDRHDGNGCYLDDLDRMTKCGERTKY